MTNLKILITLTLLLVFVACSTDADDEYVFEAAVVCPDNARGTFTDERDGQEYKYTTVGDRKWMAQNLNYSSKNSSCLYQGDSCSFKGRSYKLDGLDSVCPEGWHLPSQEEWSKLYEVVGGDSIAALRLKSSDGWKKLNPEDGPSGTDDCGFSIIPARSTRKGSESFVAAFWTSTKQSETFTSNVDAVDIWPAYDSEVFSVRCVEDR